MDESKERLFVRKALRVGGSVMIPIPTKIRKELGIVAGSQVVIQSDRLGFSVSPRGGEIEVTVK